MKNLFLLCVVVSLYSCVKVQKKSEVDQQTDSNVQVEVRKEPVIFVLDEVMTLTQDTVIVADEVHLKSNARIYNRQFALNIQATSIYIDRGVFIKTFADEQLVAPVETPAIDGGVVHIIANDIHGNLQVFMNGQRGGDGLPGWQASEGSFIMPGGYNACLPDGGKDSAVSGSFFLEVNQSQEFSITTSMKVAEGGFIGHQSGSPYDAIFDPKKKTKVKDQKNCSVIPKTGKPGIPGQICLKLSATDLTQCEKFY